MSYHIEASFLLLMVCYCAALCSTCILCFWNCPTHYCKFLASVSIFFVGTRYTSPSKRFFYIISTNSVAFKIMY